MGRRLTQIRRIQKAAPRREPAEGPSVLEARPAAQQDFETVVDRVMAKTKKARARLAR